MPHTNYLDESLLPFPFCPGCGHGTILDALNDALISLQLDPQKTVIITDIGCCGLSDKYFKTNALHGLHGRSVTYATGIKLVNPDLHVIVLIGDGGCGIGGHHLINAARRNIGISVIVFNNLNYGMTGGEHSVTTIPGARTSTTWYGHLEKPIDICSTVLINGATYVARATAFEPNLSELIAKAILNDGFSLIDIWELCTAHYVPKNRLNKERLSNAINILGFKRGIIHHEVGQEYSKNYQRAVIDKAGEIETPMYLDDKYQSSMSGTLKYCIAGSAGMRIGAAASIFCQGAILSGLWATQRNDYPVTVRTGYSLSEVIISEQNIQFFEITQPDVVVLLSIDGYNKVKKLLGRLTESNLLYVLEDLASQIQTQAKVIPLKNRDLGGRKRLWAIKSLAILLQNEKYFPLDALEESAGLIHKFANEYQSTIRSTLPN